MKNTLKPGLTFSKTLLVRFVVDNAKTFERLKAKRAKAALA